MNLYDILSIFRENETFSSPTRLLLMIYIVGRRRGTVTELANALGVAPSTVEAHLKKLEEQGFLRKRKVLDGARVAVIIEPTEEGKAETLLFLRRLRVAIDEVYQGLEARTRVEGHLVDR